MQESILASFLFIGIISVIVNIAVFAGMDLILKLMRIPEDIYTYMKKYVWVIFWGIFFVFLYNFFCVFAESSWKFGNAASLSGNRIYAEYYS